MAATARADEAGDLTAGEEVVAFSVLGIGTDSPVTTAQG